MSYDYQRWFAEIKREGGKVPIEDYFARLKWEMVCCYRAIDRLRKLADATGDTALLQDAQVLDHTIRTRIALDDKRLRETGGRRSKIPDGAYRKAWEDSPTGTKTDIARRLKVDVKTLARWIKCHPGEELPKKNRA